MIIATRLMLASAFGATTLCAATHAVTAADTLSPMAIGDLRPSPDGKTIVFSVARVDLAANKTRSHLMRISAAGGTPSPIEAAPEGASTVRWSPDGGRIAFIASDPDAKTSAIYTLDLASSKLTRVCEYRHSNSYLAHAGNALAWSPDGSRLAFAGTLEEEPATRDPLVVTRIQYKTRTAFSDNRRTHLFVVSADGGGPRALTSGKFDEHSLDWGGDGHEIVFLSNHGPDPDALLNYDIFAVDVATGTVRQLTHTPGVETNPKVSPDGRSVAYTATKRTITTIDSMAEDDHAWVIPIAGGTGREVNAKLDRRTSAVEWAPDSKSIIYTAADHGSNLVCTTYLSTDETSCAIGRGAQAMAPAVSGDGSATFAMSTPGQPAEIFRVDEASRAPRQLTRLNEGVTSSWQMSRPEVVECHSFDGITIQGWLYPALNTSGRPPLILLIHGGPHGQFGYAFNPTAQFYAGRGYAVLTVNPRGSSGYGQKFSDGSLDAWGGGDYKDLMAGLDAVLKTHSNIDPNRLFVTGGSYGGFMTNWVITQTSRFKAAVAAASVSDLVSFYATSLYQDLIHAEFNGFPWTGDNYAHLWKWSPLAHIANATTPTMFLHGENDNDVHITQAEEMFTALRERGIEAELVRYPREGHGFREPRHREDSLNRTVEWFDAHQPGKARAISQPGQPIIPSHPGQQ